MAQARSAASPPASICSPSHWCRFCGMYSRNTQRGARRGLLESLDPASCMRSAAPVGDGPFGRQRAGAVGTRGVAVAVVVEGAHPLALLPQQVEVHVGHHVLVVEREPVGLDRPPAGPRSRRSRSGPTRRRQRSTPPARTPRLRPVHARRRLRAPPRAWFERPFISHPSPVPTAVISCPSPRSSAARPQRYEGREALRRACALPMKDL